MSAGSSTATARIRAPAWLTKGPMSYRLSMRGFTISTRCPAISARRRRRISSSLLPLNMGPQTTSSQPPWSGKSLITRPTLMGRSDGLLRVLELVLGETAEAHDAQEPPVLRHRQVAEVALEHHLGRVLDRRLGLDRYHALGHPLAHPRLGRACPLRHGAEDVALGDDADHPHHVLHHDDGADARVHHLLGGLADGRRRIDAQDVPVHDLRDGCHARSLTEVSGADERAAGP